MYCGDNMIGRWLVIALLLLGPPLCGCTPPRLRTPSPGDRPPPTTGRAASGSTIDSNRSGAKDTTTAAPDAYSGRHAREYTIEVIGTDWENGLPEVREEVKIYSDATRVRHGQLTLYWENGQEKRVTHYVDGVEHGPKATWYLDGQLWSEGEFRNGKEHGTWKAWYSGGDKRYEFHMDNGAMHGLQTFWHGNGRKGREGMWIHGKQTGIFTVWDEEGQIVREIDYGPPEP